MQWNNQQINDKQYYVPREKDFVFVTIITYYYNYDYYYYNMIITANNNNCNYVYSSNKYIIGNLKWI